MVEPVLNLKGISKSFGALKTSRLPFIPERSMPLSGLTAPGSPPSWGLSREN